MQRGALSVPGWVGTSLGTPRFGNGQSTGGCAMLSRCTQLTGGFFLRLPFFSSAAFLCDPKQTAGSLPRLVNDLGDKPSFNNAGTPPAWGPMAGADTRGGVHLPGGSRREGSRNLELCSLLKRLLGVTQGLTPALPSLPVLWAGRCG